MATFAGFKTLSLQGAIISSVALVLPMLIITGRVFKLYDKFNTNKYVQSVLYFLRPTSCALICAVGVKLFYRLVLNSNISLDSLDFKALCVLLVLFALTFKLKRTPIIYMGIAGVCGIVLYLCKVM